MTSWHKTGAHPFYIGMYIHMYTHIYVHKNTSQKECLHIFSVTRGVRQGCSSAPLLWTTVMVLLLDSLQHTVPLQWIQNNITIYADDIHVFLHF